MIRKIQKKDLGAILKYFLFNILSSCIGATFLLVLYKNWLPI